jgi:hypothetical protein
MQLIWGESRVMRRALVGKRDAFVIEQEDDIPF